MSRVIRSQDVLADSHDVVRNLFEKLIGIMRRHPTRWESIHETSSIVDIPTINKEEINIFLLNNALS